MEIWRGHNGGERIYLSAYYSEHVAEAVKQLFTWYTRVSRHSVRNTSFVSLAKCCVRVNRSL